MSFLRTSESVRFPVQRRTLNGGNVGAICSHDTDSVLHSKRVLLCVGATPLTWVPRRQCNAREILLALDPTDPRQWLSANQRQEPGGMAVVGVTGA